MGLGVQSLQRGPGEQVGKGGLQTVLPDDILGRFQGSFLRTLGVFFFLLVPARLTCKSMLLTDHRPFASDLELENLGMN